MRVQIGDHGADCAGASRRRQSRLAIASILFLTLTPVGASRADAHHRTVPVGPRTLQGALARHPQTIRGVLAAQLDVITARNGDANHRTAATRTVAASSSTAEVLRARAPGGSNLLALHYEGALRMIDGRDGSTVWEISRPDWQSAWMTGDVNGDGFEDVLLLQINDALGSDGIVIHITFDQQIEAISGATGERLWERVEPLAADAAGPLVAYPVVVDIFLLRVQNLVVPGVFDTLTTKPSIFFDQFDWEYGKVDIDGIRANSVSAVEHAVIVDGNDGTERARVETRTLSGGFPYTIPLADLDGDGGSDLLVWEFTQYPAGERTGLAAFRGVSAFSGADAHRLWTANDFPDVTLTGRRGYDPRDTFPLALPAPAGHVPDVLIVNVGQPRVGIELRDGATGSSRWHDDLGSDAFYRRMWLPGDVDGDGSSDALVMVERAACTIGYACGDLTSVDLIALEGDDGHELWRRSFAPRDVVDVSEPTADFDGDGVRDVLVQDDAGDFAAVAARDGRTLWHKAATNVSLMPIPLLADFNGDGNADLAWTEGRHLPRGDVEAVVILSGADGNELWSSEEDGYYLSSIGFAADLDLSRAGIEFAQPLALGPPEIDAFSSAGDRLWRA